MVDTEYGAGNDCHSRVPDSTRDFSFHRRLILSCLVPSCFLDIYSRIVHVKYSLGICVVLVLTVRILYSANQPKDIGMLSYLVDVKIHFILHNFLIFISPIFCKDKYVYIYIFFFSAITNNLILHKYN